MRLCDKDIIKWLDNEKINIKPKPLLNRIHGATVDISLGNKFRVFQERHTVPYIDLSGSKKEIESTLNMVMSNEIYLQDNNSFFLHPNELVLGITQECITLPNNVIGWLDGRSSLGRLGLMVHATSHRIDPGWYGNIVLEFYNSGKIPLSLSPGMIIGALSFEILSGESLYPYNRRKNAKYKNQDNVIASKISEDKILI